MSTSEISFAFNKLKFDDIIFILGKHNCGKTQFIKYILNIIYGKDLKRSLIITSRGSKIRTNDSSEYTEYKNAKIKYRLSSITLKNHAHKPNSGGCIVIDNRLPLVDWTRNRTYDELFKQNGVMKIIALPLPLGFWLDYKDKINYFIILNGFDAHAIKRIHMLYASFMELNDFIKMYKNLTEYECLIINVKNKKIIKFNQKKDIETYASRWCVIS